MYLMDRVSFELKVSPGDIIVKNLNDLLRCGSKEEIGDQKILECLESSNSLEQFQYIRYDY